MYGDTEVECNTKEESSSWWSLAAALVLMVSSFLIGVMYGTEKEHLRTVKAVDKILAVQLDISRELNSCGFKLAKAEYNANQNCITSAGFKFDNQLHDNR